LHRGHERTRHQQQVVPEHSYKIEESGVSRRYFAGFNAGNVYLGQADKVAEGALTPAARTSSCHELPDQVGWQTGKPMPFVRRSHISR
jgi:hypothetical protein